MGIRHRCSGRAGRRVWLIVAGPRRAQPTAVVACALAGKTGSLRVLEKLGLERVREPLR
jgi:hypothetical protein